MTMHYCAAVSCDISPSPAFSPFQQNVFDAKQRFYSLENYLQWMSVGSEYYCKYFLRKGLDLQNLHHCHSLLDGPLDIVHLMKEVF
jgi:hypothetical protein